MTCILRFLGHLANLQTCPIADLRSLLSGVQLFCVFSPFASLVFPYAKKREQRMSHTPYVLFLLEVKCVTSSLT